MALTIIWLGGVPVERAPAQPPSSPFWSYQCPAPGTELEGSDGLRLRYGDAAPETPMLCTVDGLGPRLLGLPAAARDWESLTPAQLDGMFRTGQGGGLSVSRAQPERCRQGFGLDSEYLTTGIERLAVPAVGLDVIVLRYDRTRYECAMVAEFERTTIWLDRARALPLRLSIRRGLPAERPGGRPQEVSVEWHAVSLAPPP